MEACKEIDFVFCPHCDRVTLFRFFAGIPSAEIFPEWNCLICGKYYRRVTKTELQEITHSKSL